MENIVNNENSAKTVDFSKTHQIQILMSEHINGAGRLFGGKLMEWIDIVAAVTARRHCGKNVTTAEVDNLTFKAGAFSNDLLVLRGQLTYVGKTSMEVRVDTFVECLSGERKHINRAYLVMVAIDENNKPVPVPPLILSSEQEKLEWEAAKKRRELRKQRQCEEY